MKYLQGACVGPTVFLFDDFGFEVGKDFPKYCSVIVNLHHWLRL